MKTPAKRILLLSALVCSSLALGLERSAAGPKESRRSVTDSAVAPNTTFNDNVVINTPNNPVLSLNQNTGQGLPAQNWEIHGNETFFAVKDSTGLGPFPFLIYKGAPAGSLVVYSDGRMGIGANPPAEALHIVRTVTPAIRLEQISPAQTWDLRASQSGFSIIDVTAGTFPLRVITGSGNVGIGTSDPAGKLHVNGAGAQLSIFQSSNNDAVQFRLQTNSTNRRFVALNAAGQQQSQLLFGDNGAFDFLGPTAADVRMRFLANGNVGIGTTSPDQKLSVNGNASKPGGGSWATFSDERLKDIKGKFTSGLDAVMKLQPIRYEYKTDNAVGITSEGEHIGFGAEAVSKVIPEAVSRSENGYLMIDNDPILWTMLNAIKEQNAQNAELKTEVATQGAQMKVQNEVIAQLKVQLERLQAQLVLQAGNPKVQRMRGATNVNR